jgi:hypothetical protein
MIAPKLAHLAVTDCPSFKAVDIRASDAPGADAASLPALRAVVFGGFKASEVRSIHWSPYDRVRVVNADP